jgi:hypothetical protein
MNFWDENHIEDKIIQILHDIPDAIESHPFGRPYLTAYQLAIEFARRFPADFQQLDLPVGRVGIGQRTSLAQYLARELSRHIRNGSVIQIEGGFLSNQHLSDMSFLNGEEVFHSSLTDSGFPLSMFRLRE